jgi:mycothiol system anti-sigma-R factor
MGCVGDHVDCDEVLSQVYEYLHEELEPARAREIRDHLGRCGHCLRQYDLESEVQALIARSCACTPAPEELRNRIIQRIAEVRYSQRTMASADAFFTETVVTFRSQTLGAQGPRTGEQR